MTTDRRIIAARLGVDEVAVRRLQARGHLRRLDASEAEIRARLFAAAYARWSRPTRHHPRTGFARLPDESLDPMSRR